MENFDYFPVVMGLLFGAFVTGIGWMGFFEIKPDTIAKNIGRNVLGCFLWLISALEAFIAITLLFKILYKVML
jgi:hypothetical protein